MATQSFDNYTITNVTYQVTGGTNVYTSHQTAVLTISLIQVLQLQPLILAG